MKDIFNKKFNDKYPNVRKPLICNGLKEIKPFVEHDEEQPEEHPVFSPPPTPEPRVEPEPESTTDSLSPSS